MSSNGVSEVSAGAGRMVNGTSFASGSIAGSGAFGGCRPVGAETWVDNDFVEVEGFSEGDREGFDKEVLG